MGTATTDKPVMVGIDVDDITLHDRIDHLEKAASRKERIIQGQQKYTTELTLKIVDLEFRLKKTAEKSKGRRRAIKGLEIALLREKVANRISHQPRLYTEAHREAREGIGASE